MIEGARFHHPRPKKRKRKYPDETVRYLRRSNAEKLARTMTCPVIQFAAWLKRNTPMLATSCLSPIRWSGMMDRMALSSAFALKRLMPSVSPMGPNWVTERSKDCYTNARRRKSGPTGRYHIAPNAKGPFFHGQDIGKGINSGFCRGDVRLIGCSLVTRSQDLRFLSCEGRRVTEISEPRWCNVALM